MVEKTGSSSELMAAVRGLSAARGLPPEVILDALKAALISAYHKIPGAEESQVTVEINEDTGETRVLAHYTVVEEQYIEDAESEITTEQAELFEPDPQIGDAITVDVTPDDFGRIAAQTAKQVILQRIREAEREQTYTTYAEREGEIVYGTVQTASRDNVTVALDRVEALLPKSQQIPGERYSPNQRVRVFVSEVKRSPKGPQVIVSRTHRDMLKSLMELEIPEIFQGIVEIKGIAREAGSRSKVAVWSHQEGVDPVGACVGMRGVRIQALVRELGGEKIDIVQWDPDPRVFIAHALSPANVHHVWLEEEAERRTANVVVPDNQLSLAIGREGQNARLAAKLTGWRIDIRAESEAAEELAEVRAAEDARRADRTRQAQEAADAQAAAIAAIADAEPAYETEDQQDEPVEQPTEDVLAPAAEVARVVGAVEAPGLAEVAEAPVSAAPAGEAEAAEKAHAPSAGEAPAWKFAQRAVPATDEDEEEAALLGVGGGTKRRRKPRRLVRDPVTGELVARQERKQTRRRPEWEEDIGRWSEEKLDEIMDFTELDFVGPDAADESADEDAADESADETTEDESEDEVVGEVDEDNA